MSSNLIIRLFVAGLVVAVLTWLGFKIQGMDPGMMFVTVFVTGAVSGVLVVKFILPGFGDAVASFFYSSGELMKPDESSRAVARLAQGDYAGAIAEYEKILIAKPEDMHAIGEVSRILAHKMENPQGALDFLQRHLDSREWDEDSTAFMMFRQADIRAEVLHDSSGTQAVLEDVVRRLPNTRHSANAHHRINQLREAEFKAAAKRMKPGDYGTV